MSPEWKSIPAKSKKKRRARFDPETEQPVITPSLHRGQQVSREDVLQLQTLIGNRRVQRLIASQSLSAAPAVTGHLQRQGVVDTVVEKVKDAAVAIYDAAVQIHTAYKLWVGEGKEDWTKAKDDEKKEYIEKAKKHLETVKLMQDSQGFKDLKTEEQDKLLALVGGTNYELSVPANKKLRALLDGPDKKFNPKKATAFRKFMKDQGWLPGVVAPTAGTFAGKVAKYKVNGPTEVKGHKFESKTADANKYEVEIGKLKIPVYVPKTPDPKAGEFHSIEEVAKGLATLPEAELKAVTAVYVEPARNPDDAYWAKEYKRPDFRSYMTAGASGVINIYPSKGKETQEYLQGTMIHETGHVLSQQKWGKNAEKDPGWKPWRDAMKKDGFAASKYAQASVDEDFAEALQLYEQVHGKPQEAEIEQIMPERVKLIRKLLSGK